MSPQGIVWAVGIDPGLKGGVAWCTSDGAEPGAEALPTRKGRREVLDVRALATILHALTKRGRIGLVVVEESLVRPAPARKVKAPAGATLAAMVEAGGIGDQQGRGSISNASSARMLGHIEAVVDLMGARRENVSPQAWQRHLLSMPPKGTPQEKRRGLIKAESIAQALRRFPGVDLMPGRCRTPQDGLADALNLAEFARRIMVGAPR